MHRTPVRFLSTLLALLVVLAAAPIGVRLAAASGLVAGSYTSPSFGYALAWDDSWSLIDETSDENGDILALENGVSIVLFHGRRDMGSDNFICAESFFAELIMAEGTRGARYLLDDDGNPVRRDGANRTIVVYAFTGAFEDGIEEDFVASVDCRALAAQEAVLRIVAVTPREVYDDQRSLVRELLTGLVLPSAEEPAPTEEPTPAEAANRERSGGEVPQDRGDAARTGAMPGPGPAGEPVELWRLEVGGYVESPVLANGLAYIGTGSGALLALDAATGEEVWRLDEEGRGFGAPAVADGVVYAGAADPLGGGAIYVALDATTGDEAWRIELDGSLWFAAVVVADGALYAVGPDPDARDRADHALYALDAATGDEAWRFAAGGPVTAPAVAGGRVYVGSQDTLYALDAATGDEVWRFAADGSVLSPAVGAGVVVFSAGDAYVAVDADTGEPWWTFAPEPSVSIPAIVDRVVYVDGDDTLYALDVGTGEERWAFAAGEDAGPAAVAGGVVYVGSWDGEDAGSLHALDAARGEELWRFAGESNLATAAPVVVDGVVYAGTGTGILYVVGGSEAAEPGRDETPEPRPTPADATGESGQAVDGTLYTSPSYGYLLSWDRGWSVLADSSREGRDLVRLGNGETVATLMAYPAAGADPARCLDDAVADLADDPGVEDVSFQGSLDGQAMPGGDATSAVAGYIYTTTEGGTAREMAFLVQCRFVLPGEALLRIAGAFPMAAFEGELLAFFAILDAVVLPGLPGTPVPAMPGRHIGRGEAHEPYNSSPPTSGPHYDTVAPWGVRTVPIAPEVQVHNLEHGGILLQYSCACPEAVALLERFADPVTGYPVKVIAAPYPDMEAEIAFTAWHHVWTMPASELTPERVRAFIEAHIDHGFEHIPDETALLAAWRDSDAPKP